MSLTMPEAPSTGSVELFVPGRLCLFGEHSDWAAAYRKHRGYCLVIGTEQGLRARATADESFTVESTVPNQVGRRLTCPWRAEDLLAAATDPDQFFRYCAGVAHQMQRHPGVDGGLALEITAMDLPLGKGAASSAAVCILVARAFDSVYRLGLLPHEVMDLAYQGERLTGSQCGRMDQACIYGQTPVLVTFDGPDACRVEPISPGGRIDLLVVDLAGQKNTVGILADLQQAYAGSADLQAALGIENERLVRRGYQALVDGDADAFGALMIEAQSLFDRCIGPHSRHLASPLLHEVLALPELAPHVLGGKGVGSQGDGMAQFVARSGDHRRGATECIAGAYPQMTALPLTIWPAGRRGEDDDV